MNLPSQIFAKILSYLDDKQDLKNCLLVSQEFREVIIKTPNLMRKFDVILYGKEWKNNLEFIEKFGEYVIGLQISSINFKDETEIVDILKFTPNVERLRCKNIYIYTEPPDWGELFENVHENEEVIDEDLDCPEVAHENEDNNIQESADGHIMENTAKECSTNNSISLQDNPENLVKSDEFLLNFPNLTHLDLKLNPELHQLVTKCLKNCKTLKSLKVMFKDDKNCDYLKLVCQQDDLEELYIENYNEQVLDTVFIAKVHEKVKFKLKKLSARFGLSFNENFVEFLKSQSENVQHLELFCHKMNFRYLQVVLTHFKVLESFRLYIDNLLTEERIEEIKNYRLESVKCLEFRGDNRDITTFKVLVNIFPNIETLKLQDLTNFSLEGILDNFENLSTLKIEYLACQSLLNVSLSNLKTMHIVRMHRSPISTLWDAITKNCPNIEQLKIEKFINSGHSPISGIQDFSNIFEGVKNLRKLKYFQVNTLEPLDYPDDADDELFNDFYVQVNVVEKSIKVASFFAQNFEDEINILREIFVNFIIEEV